MAAIPADPWSAGLMAAGSVASAALQKPNMTAQQTIGPLAFDNSGWNVNLGLGSGPTTMATTTDRSASALGVSKLLSNPTMLILAAVGLYLILGKK
ncbi:MAG: hypothetical protein WCC39_02585 [Telluria sp.]